MYIYKAAIFIIGLKLSKLFTGLSNFFRDFYFSFSVTHTAFFRQKYRICVHFLHGPHKVHTWNRSVSLAKTGQTNLLCYIWMLVFFYSFFLYSFKERHLLDLKQRRFYLLFHSVIFFDESLGRFCKKIILYFQRQI